MKKEISFTAVMTVSGLFAGLAITAILMAIATPNMTNAVLTISEKNDFQTLGQATIWISENTTLFVYTPAIILSVISFLFYLSVLNPGMNATRLKSRTAALKMALVVVACLMLPFIFAILETILGITIRRPFVSVLGEGQVPGSIIPAFIEAAILGALVWCIAGEKGWAGDFSGFKMRISDKKEAYFECLVLGAIAAVLATALFLFFEFIFNTFFILISEVYDRSGETSFLGFKILAVLITSMTSAAACIIAGLTLALAPSARDWSYRVKCFILPVLLSVIMGGTFWGMYAHASNKYDLNKKDLAQAVGLPAETDHYKTMIVLREAEGSKNIRVQKWPMTVRGDGMMAGGTIAVSYKNLETLQDYIEAHKDGSVFRYAAEDALYKGYYVLWDMAKAKASQFAASQDLLLPRMQMIAKMKYLPITEENMGYLKGFTDETLWFVGGKSALKIAEGFIHFNLFDQAGQWLAKARKMETESYETSKIELPAKSVLTTGKIFGHIRINGKAAQNTKAAIFTADRLKPDEVKLWSLMLAMVDAQDLGSKGGFSFENLGEEQYALAVLTDTTILVSDTPTIRITNPPGVIPIGNARTTADLGIIEIAFPPLPGHR